MSFPPRDPKSFSWRTMEAFPESRPCAGAKVIDVAADVAQASAADQESKSFQLDLSHMTRTSLSKMDRDSAIEDLNFSVFDQADLEKGIMLQVDEALEARERTRRRRCLQRHLTTLDRDATAAAAAAAEAKAKMKRLEEEERRGRTLPFGVLQENWDALALRKQESTNIYKVLREKRKRILAEVEEKEAGGKKNNIEESERERRIRIGEITPFGTVGDLSNNSIVKPEITNDAINDATNPVKPDNANYSMDNVDMVLETVMVSTRSRKRSVASIKCDPDNEKEDEEWRPIFSEVEDKDEEKEEEEEEEEEDREETTEREKRKKKRRERTRKKMIQGSIGKRPAFDDNDIWDDDDDDPPAQKIVRLTRVVDDGDVRVFERRIAAFELSTRAKATGDGLKDVCLSGEGGDLTIPGVIWSKLYSYQRTGVRWLWELHQQQCGGIVGDEMGLGKTIQVIAFLAGLRASRLRALGFPFIGLGPVLVVAPATVLLQWVNEFHTWFPLIRVAILHDTGSFKGTKSDLIWDIVEAKGVLLTSYSSVVANAEELADRKWHYVILDEGHKIRNPDAQVTLSVKRLKTPHRLVMSGTPIQNNLKELWSLFDFVFPGKLGTLPAFMTHFAVPIVQGGYASASEIQVMTSYKCACVLRDTISPYLLRRMKSDLSSSLKMPGKTEQVLFCRLTPEQVRVYKQYQDSEQCQAILRGNYKVFVGLITLRKICNHPDLASGGPRLLKGENIKDKETEFGYFKRSGKLVVVDALLKLWRKQGHRVLIFSQSREMLNVLEKFVLDADYSYLRLDGATGVGVRQNLINRFNQDESIFVFLLTTKVGGLGVNLVGADRIVIFDPDWNPSTDAQARERAWRIGQHKQVTIYRLLCSGTIEEKIYHRQIFKQFLTNRILKDPKQRRLFKANDLHELFSLSKDYDEQKIGETETAAIFAGSGLEVGVGVGRRKRSDRRKEDNIFDRLEKEEEEESNKIKMNTRRRMNEEEKKRRMLERAKELSKKILESKKGIVEGKMRGGGGDEGVKKKATTNLEEKKKEEGEICDSDAFVSEASTTSLTMVRNDLNSTLRDSEEFKTVKRKIRKEKKNNKRRGAKFEGRRIKGLDKWENCARPKSRDEQEKKDEREDSAAKSRAQDDYVLAKLFKKSSVHSALRHDAIMDSEAPDYAIVEAEAKRVAAEAAARLKVSRRRCAPAAAGVPTWTGTNGVVVEKRPKFGTKKNTKLLTSCGEEEEKKPLYNLLSSSSTSFPTTTLKFDCGIVGSVGIDLPQSELHVQGILSEAATSSADLIKKMRLRNAIGRDVGKEVDDEVSTYSRCLATAEDDELIDDIRDFVAFQSRNQGRASTQELLRKFRDRVAPGDAAKFKSMLKRICRKERSIDGGTAEWTLKEEFR